jgi:hypothetical protein
MRSIWTFGILAGLIMINLACSGSKDPPPYGVEEGLYLPAIQRQVWAVAPAINQSGVKEVDPFLQADLLYNQLQQVVGLTVIPVNRVADVYNAMRIDRIKSEEQAKIVCDLLGADAILIATVTMYDPYNPPKMGVSLTLISRGDYRVPGTVDPRSLARAAAPTTRNIDPTQDLMQVVEEFDASNGSVRNRLQNYAAGRNDPESPLGARIYLMEMDRYAQFVYHSLLSDLLRKPGVRKM